MPVRLLWLAVLLCAVRPAAGQEFPIEHIPAALLVDADAVVRLDEQTFTVRDARRAVLEVRRVVTILNADGRDAAAYGTQYNEEFHKIKRFTGAVYDASGKRVKRLRGDDRVDVSLGDGFSLFSGSRLRYAQLEHNRYPYTVEFSFEMHYDGLLSWPGWRPQERDQAVQRALFTLRVPQGTPFRHKQRGGLDVEPMHAQEGGTDVWAWVIDNVPAHEPEPLGPSWQEQVPSLMLTPDAFEIGGHPGTLDSWDALGQWYHELNAGRDVLPPETVATVERLTEGAASDLEKAQRLYEYMQSHTRYVSIQLGIGGWQTFPAEYVVENGYGDCKALTNYMQALLKAAGVQAYAALVRAGDNEPALEADFPHNGFNHVILYVPMADEDDVWLECTSQISPFGHLGTFTEDRDVLVVTPKGGALKRTPQSDAAANRQTRHATLTLDPNGNALAEVTTTYTGNQQGRVRRRLAHATASQREDWLRGQLEVPSVTLTASDFANVDERTPEVRISGTFELPRYATQSGPRIFLKPNLMERWSNVPPTVDERTQPLRLGYAYADADTVTFALPEGYVIEAAPAPVDLVTDFGHYRAAVEMSDDGALRFVRTLTVNAAELPAELYDAYRAFVTAIVKNDRMQVVLVKK